MGTKSKDIKVEKLTERIRALELILGFDENNKRNGNGLITLIEEISKRQNDKWASIDRLRKDTDNLEIKLTEINEQLNRLSFEIGSLSEKISDIDKKLKEHSEIMNGVMTGNKIRTMAKDFALFVAVMAGLGTIFGIIAYLYNRIRGHI